MLLFILSIPFAFILHKNLAISDQPPIPIPIPHQQHFNNPCKGHADFDCGLGELRDRCIPSLWLCDNIYDCSTGQDETKCAYLHKCPPGTLMCLNGDCILAQHRCDGIMQCLDGTDERGCSNIGPVAGSGMHPFPWAKKNFVHQSPAVAIGGPISTPAAYHRNSHQPQMAQHFKNNAKEMDAIDMAKFDGWFGGILTILLAFLIFGQIIVMGFVCIRRHQNQCQRQRQQHRRHGMNGANDGNGGLRRTRVRFVAVGFKRDEDEASLTAKKKESADDGEEICSIEM